MNKICRYILTITLILLFAPCMGGAERRDSVVVSLITCAPGSEVYELCGHEALRVRGIYNGQQIDTAWNYGVFDFNAPNFIYRFVKGETDYMLAGYPFEYFMPEYIDTGRKVIEQDLNLTDEQALRLYEMLLEEGKPENRTYRYNYVRDNCATRIVDRIDSVAGAPVVYPDNIKYGTFRNEMRSYHKAYPWYQFGIDLALGSGIDIPIGGKEEMFVPIEMAAKADEARFADGRPLVKASRVLNQGVANASLPPTPWYLTPLTLSWLLFSITFAISLWMWIRGRLARWIYSLWFGLTGLAGCIVTFLVFISVHEATSPNVLILWLNPLQLLIAFTIWSRKLRGVSYAVSYYNIVVLISLFCVWPFQLQSANAAFFPLMGITLMLAVTFATIAPKNYSFNNKGEKTFNMSKTLPTARKATRKSQTTGNRRK